MTLTAQMGRTSWNKGKKLSITHREKISAALKGVKLSPEHCAKISAGHKGKKLTPEQIANAETKKQCSICGEWKKLNEFYVDETRKCNRASGCKVCRRIRAKKSRNRPHSIIYHRDKSLKQNYGIGLDKFLNMIKEQDGLCAACGQPLNGTSGQGCFSPVVDHDHKTGKVRQIIHGRCNTIIGHADDNPEILRKCMEYLERHHR